MDVTLTKRIDDFCADCGISRVLGSAKAVIVGFSGGADSSLLLSYLSENFSGKVAAAHLDHMLRGDEAARDLEFCREFCKTRGIRFFFESADVSAIAEKYGKSVEECGRDLRYELFYKCRKELSEELSCPVSEVAVATAHNADDNLETVVFNITRGSALRGVAGIPPARDGYLVRPLLCFASDEIRDACVSEGIPFVTDSTNDGDEYTRNRIRHNVIPELKKINPKAPLGALSLSRAAACADSYFVREADSLIDKYSESFPREVLNGLDRAVASYVVTGLYSRVMPEESLSSSHIEAILDAEKSMSSGILHLPGNVSAYYGRALEFIVEKEKGKASPFLISLHHGENPVEKCGFSVGVYSPGEDFEADENNIYKELIYKITVNDKIKNSLFIRNRAESDVYLFGGHHRKLKKLLCDAGVPRYKRSSLPVVCDDEGIVWVPGFPQRDGTRPSDEDCIKSIITYREMKGDADNG